MEVGQTHGEQVVEILAHPTIHSVSNQKISGYKHGRWIRLLVWVVYGVVIL